MMTMGITKPWMKFFAILATITIVQCTEHLNEQEKSEAIQAINAASESILRNGRAANNYEFLPFGGTPSELLDMSDGFLAGENTPVWLARRRSLQEPVSYIKLEPGVVGRAVNYWRSLHSGNRGRRSTDGYTNSTRSKRSSTQARVLYPSVLAVLDYGGYPGYKQSQDVWVNEGILYALSFWNSVDLQLRYINRPSVRIRLAGIVLGESKAATPYILNNERDGKLNVDDAIGPMMAYWNRMARINPDFNPDAYDTVATMTSSRRHGFYHDYTEPTDADTIPPCSPGYKGINGMIIHDDTSYRGIQAAVHSMARILGASQGQCGLLDGDVMEMANGEEHAGYGRKWSACTLQEIVTYLRTHGSCMERPKEYHYPGRPVQIILPGKVDSVKEQCRTVLKGEEPWDCFDYMKDSPCGNLICTVNTYKFAPCRGFGQFVADGSWCDVGFSGNGRKICLDGQCVNDPTL